MKTFREFFCESAVKNDHILDKFDMNSSYEVIQSYLKGKIEHFCKLVEQSSFYESDLLWRGFRTGGLSLLDSCLLRIKSRSNFRGAVDIMSSAVDRILTLLKLKDKPIIFTVHDKSYASFFGTPYIVVPEEPFVSYMSEEVRDLKNIESTINKEQGGKTIEAIKADSEQKIKEYAESYKLYKNSIPYHPENEVIINCDSYYMLSPLLINKLGKKKKLSEIKTYKALVTELRAYFDIK